MHKPNLIIFSCLGSELWVVKAGRSLLRQSSSRPPSGGHEGPTAHLGAPQEKATSGVTGGGLKSNRQRRTLETGPKPRQLQSGTLDPDQEQRPLLHILLPLAAAQGERQYSCPPSLSLGSRVPAADVPWGCGRATRSPSDPGSHVGLSQLGAFSHSAG